MCKNLMVSSPCPRLSLVAMSMSPVYSYAELSLCKQQQMAQPYKNSSTLAVTLNRAHRHLVSDSSTTIQKSLFPPKSLFQIANKKYELNEHSTNICIESGPIHTLDKNEVIFYVQLVLLWTKVSFVT